MKNNYGNFVVQKALKLAKGLMKMKLLNCIIKNIDKIGDKKIMAKWESIVSMHIIPQSLDFSVDNHTLPVNKKYRSNNYICCKGKSRPVTICQEKHSSIAFFDGQNR